MKKSKITSYMLVVALIFSMFTSFGTFTPEIAAASSYHDYKPDKIGITTESLNVRKSAGTKYSVIGSLSSNKTITVYGYKIYSGDKWYKVKNGSKYGYVISDYVKITGTKTSYYKYTKGQKSGKILGSLNVRSGPATSYSIVGNVSENDIVKMYGYKTYKNEKWYKIKIGSGYGYVYSKYVKNLGYLDSKTETNVSTTTKSEDKDYVYSKLKIGKMKENLNVRSGPGTEYSKVGSVSKGDTETMYGYKVHNGQKWYKIKDGSGYGYVYSKYVDNQGYASKTTSSTADFNYTYGKLKVGQMKVKLTVRSGPGTSYSSLGTLSKDDKNTMYGYKIHNGEKWYKIKAGSSYGYIYSKYVTNLGYLVKDVVFTSASIDESTADSVTTADAKDTNYVYSKLKLGKMKEQLNVRSGPGNEYSIVDSISKGETKTMYGYMVHNGEKWYKIKKDSKYVYIYSKYVTNLGYVTDNISDTDEKEVVEDNVEAKVTITDIESYMNEQGFPSSYKPMIREMYKEHPTWIYKAVNTGIDFDDAVEAESKTGVSLVASYNPMSWRSFEKGSYDFSDESFNTFDGKWYSADEDIVAYYLDPRNFIDNDSIYQFLSLNYDSNSQDNSTIRAVLNDSFMDSDEYSTMINRVGKKISVSPNGMAAMMLLEQGYKGTSGLISGTTSGYEGYYNFFNIGAYTDSKRSAVQRGLWFAKGGDDESTSYNRPWNTKEKAIEGGATYFRNNYINSNQNTLYTKKFNVLNGKSALATHQYSTVVYAGNSEGKLLGKAYADNSKFNLVFNIPIYNNMPSSKVAYKSSDASNDNLLDSLKVAGQSVSPAFDRYQYLYTVTAPVGQSSVEISAVAHDKDATVSGAGTVTLTSTNTTKKIVVTAESGKTRSYYVTIIKQ